MTQRVVVGIDGSDAAAAALCWAVAEARLREAELVAWTIEQPGQASTPQVSAATLHQLADGYPMEVRHGYGDPAEELVSACGGADLLVVGSRGHSALAGLLLGSVSRAAVSHARCTVVVVRPLPDEQRPRGRVLVGVDMSGHSREALRIAAEEARLRGADLHVVHAVHWDSTGTELITPTRQQLVGWGRDLVAAELAATGVQARPVVVYGHATDVLVRHSAHADLLVLGARGRGSLAGVLLGSTSGHCAQHARCPVMIVHPARPAAHPRVDSAVLRGEAT